MLTVRATATVPSFMSAFRSGCETSSCQSLLTSLPFLQAWFIGCEYTIVHNRLHALLAINCVHSGLQQCNLKLRNHVSIRDSPRLENTVQEGGGHITPDPLLHSLSDVLPLPATGSGVTAGENPAVMHAAHTYALDWVLD